MQSIFIPILLCALAVVFLPATQAAESCVPSTGACVIGSQAAPCCLPSVCTQPATGAAYCKGDGVACVPTGISCVANAYPYCCPQQTCKGGICSL